MKYQKKMAFVDAIQWTGDNFDEIDEFLSDRCYMYNGCLFVNSHQKGTIAVNRGEFVMLNNDNISVWTKDRFEKEFEPKEAK